MISFIKKYFYLCWNNRILRYIFFGGLTTLVNLVTYYAGRAAAGLDINTANVISVVTAILFAYFVNSRFVFETEAGTFRDRFAEFCKFGSARVSTMIIEVGGVWLMTDVLGIHDYAAKFIIQFIVLILNYIFSKFLVFRKKNGGTEKA